MIKLPAFGTPTQMLSCEVCETFKNTYFEEHLQTTATGGVLEKAVLKDTHREKAP